MKMLKSLVSVIAMSLIMVGCGGGGSSGSTSTDTTDNTNNDSTTLLGSGTIEDPYIVGNGEFMFSNEVYLKVGIQADGPLCNVIAYNLFNLNAFNETDMYNDSFSLIVQEAGYIYPVDANGNYIIKAETWPSSNNGVGAVGIYSKCITSGEPYSPDIVKTGLNTFAGEANHLYKIELNQSSMVELSRIDNTDYVYFYNAELENVYGTYGDSHVVDLQAGTNYVLVGSFRDEEATIFSVTVTPN